MAIKVGMISLGCSKNQVDGEKMLALLRQEGMEICPNAEECDAIIVNTCGFIEDAKKESLEAIFETSQLKKKGRLKSVVVTGCLAERYRQELADEIPEADVVLGIGSNHRIAEAVRRAVEEMGGAVRQLVPLPAAKHVFTHVEWHMTGWRVELESARGLDPSLVFTTERQRREQYAVPSAYRAYLKPPRRR